MTRRDLPAVLAVVAFAALLHAPLVGHGFTLDDVPVVAEKADLRSLSNWREVATRDWWGDLRFDRLWRPLALLSFAAEGSLHGLDARACHAANVILDALVAAALFVLARALGAGRAAAALASAWFAALGVHLEVVAGIVGRADVLAALFSLLALVAHRSERRAAGPAAAFLFGLGLLSKESAVVVPGLAVLHDLVLLRRARPARWAGMGGVLLVLLAARFAVLGSLTRPVDAALRYDNPLAAAGPVEARLTAVAVLGRYAAALAWPRGLSPNYGFDEIRIVATPLDPWFLLGLASTMVALLWALGRARRGPSPAAFGLLFWLLALLPVSNLLFLIGTARGERLLYLPSAGLALAAAAGLETLRRRSGTAAAGLFVAATALQAGLTLERSPAFRDDLALLTDAVRHAPRSVVVRYRLAHAERAAGNLAAARREYEIAESLAPENPRVRHELGELLYELGDLEEAARRFEAVASREPRDARAWNLLGSIRARQGDLVAALAAFDRAVAARPDLASAHANRGFVLIDLGRRAEAMEALEAALRADPGLEPARRARERLLR